MNSSIKISNIAEKSALKIALLASNPKLYSNQRIVESALKRGHMLEFLNVGKCYLKISPHDLQIFYDKGKEMPNFDCIIPRIKPNMTSYGVAIIRQFEAMKIRCFNGSQAILKSRDKLNTMQILAENHLPIPTTAFANSSYDTKHLIEIVNKAPLIIKLLQGTKGVGVMLAETDKTALSIINAFRSLDADILVQNYIKDNLKEPTKTYRGKDLRCFVIGDKVVASMERQAEEGEFRANIHLGAKAKAVEISKQEEELAIAVAKVIGLEIAGVDMVRSDEGSKIIEINSSPGLEGIEEATGVDIANLIIEYIENYGNH